MTGHILAKLQSRNPEYGALQRGDATIDRQSWSHWQLAWGADNVVWLFMDQPDTEVNTVSQALLEELNDILAYLEQEAPDALVLRSAKAGSFCVGANIQEFVALESQAQVMESLHAAHAVADRLQSQPYPKVAVIHGNCLGGGLELALCCDYRIALGDAGMGFPEIQLGLHPGLGGTARLTHLIDPLEAMTLMLTGKTVRAGKAQSLGLIDAVVEERHVANAVQAAIDGKIETDRSAMKARLLTTKVARQLEARQMRNKSAEKAPPEHYPAPEALISLWEEHGSDAKAMAEAEVESFARLLDTPAARSLIRVFFLRQKMKHLTQSSQTQPPIERVHVVGAGAMGGDIAGWCALQGLTVTLFDMEPQAVAQAVGNAAKLCQRKHLGQAQSRAVLDRLIPDLDNQGIAVADLVIEAVPEKIEIKQQVYQEVEPRLKEGAILATNTSSIPLQQLQEQLKDPSRLVGLHFFNPVSLMPLVEVVRHDAIDPGTLDRARAFVGQISRLPAPVASAPGFLVNRALTPYLVEAIQLLEEGVDPEAIDAVATGFGMPMGPVELADQVGLDICLGVADMLRERLDGNLPPVPDWLRKKVEEGELGRKTGHGLYQWEGNQAKKRSRKKNGAPDDCLDRLVLPMLNACMACLDEGVIEDEDLLDGAMIFGTGFAPFRGGPLHYARTRGMDAVSQSLKELAQAHGERFQPVAGWAGRD